MIDHIIHQRYQTTEYYYFQGRKGKGYRFWYCQGHNVQHTVSTNAMGSVHYTSPEQARGGFSDQRSDIYSIGITCIRNGNRSGSI